MNVLGKVFSRARKIALGIGTTLAVSSVVIGGLVFAPAAARADTAPPDPAEPKTVSTDALPTAQINGIVWDQVVVGDTVYAVGQFSSARPAGAAAGSNEVTRSNVLAYDIRSGALLPFAPSVNGQVRSVAASPDGKRLYIGGDFTAVNASTRNRVAAFDLPNGALAPGWAPSVNASVRAITATNTAVYFTGSFGRVASNDRSRAAAVSAAGALLPWAPVLDNRGNDVVVSGDGAKVAIAGYFTTVNGSSNPGYGMALVDPVSAALLPFGANGIVRNGGADAAIWSLMSDGQSLYGTGYHFGEGGNLEGIFRSEWSTGDLTWVEDCHGDTYSAFATPDVVYGAGHSHYCGSIEGGFPQSDPWTFYRGIAYSNSVQRTTPYGLGAGYYDWGGNPAPKMLHWFPTFNTGTVSGSSQGPWNVTGNSDYIVMAGEFTRVNNVGQQGIVRFARPDKAPNDDGPRISGSNWVPTANSIAQGAVRLSWPLNWDRDNEYLKYTVIRDGATATPIHTVTTRSKSPDWGLPGMSFLDRGLTQGSTHTYRVRAEDPHGNVAQSTTISVTVNGAGAMPDYSLAVLDDSPVSYWPLNDGGTTATDWAGASDLSTGSGVTRGEPGALTPTSIAAARFDGTGNGFAATQTAIAGPQTFAIEAWFKTTTTAGGKIVGFGNSATGTSSAYDRHVYMDNNGRVNFGVYPGDSRVVTSAATFNDGGWHHVVASLDPTKGMELYVDGLKVAQRSDTTSAQGYNGFWRVGGDTSWSGAPFFSGTIDEVAVYSSPLTRQQVIEHYVASGRTFVGATAPSDAYGASVYSGEPTLYWRLDESQAATTAADASGSGMRGNYIGTQQKGTAGALEGVANAAVTFSDGQLISQNAFVNPTVFSTEAWFKTSSTAGGKIIGFGSSGTGNSSNYDRHVFMTNTGQLVYGAYNGSEQRATSPGSYNDNTWHHVVATQGSNGMRLYVDGVQVASNANTSVENYTGYWHVGGDNSWGPGGNAFQGAIDEVAVYPAVLSAATIADHHSLGTAGAPTNQLPTADFTITSDKLDIAVDASTSTDPDGTITTYQWNWGDGSPDGFGATATHTYAEAGSFTVTLTVTDDRSGTATANKPAEAVANQAPTPVFSEVVTPLAVAVDAQASTDADGTITAFTWAWGDGKPTSTGATASHTYAEAGTYAVTLTVTDDEGATATLSRQVVVPPIPPNQAPTAAFTATADGLVASVTSTSSDPDGTVTGYSWNWGDGTPPASGQAPGSHGYAEAGTYTITLTVTDDDGATGTATAEITVTVPEGPAALASDAFDRSLASGLGSAAVGGAWSLANAASNYAVDGAGVFKLTAGGSIRTAYLSSVSSATTDLTVDVKVDALPTGGSVFAQALARRIGGDDYRARITIATSGSATLQVMRGATSLGSLALPGGAVTPGTTFTLRVAATGINPTTITAKAWRAGTPEPAAWQLTRTDTTASLQAPGQIGLAAAASSSLSNVPFSVRYDNLSAVQPGTGVPPTNAAPVASFTSAPVDLSVAFNAAGSTDADGTIAAYEWNFGDGSQGTGVNPSHTYATANTYSVSLRVVDDKGASHTITQPVTVTAPPQPGGPLAADEFDRTVTGGWGTAVTGGAWTLSTSSVSGYSVGAGAGNIAVAAGSTRMAYLSAVSSSSSDLTSAIVLPQLPVAGSVYASFLPRRVGADDYRARVVLAPNGSLQLQLQRTSTTLAAVNVAGVTLASGDELQVRVQAFGTSPTTIRAKVWKTGTAEPAAWQVTTTDAFAGLQAPGHVGVGVYVGSSVSNVPYTVSFGSLKVVAVP